MRVLFGLGMIVLIQGCGSTAGHINKCHPEILIESAREIARENFDDYKDYTNYPASIVEEHNSWAVKFRSPAPDERVHITVFYDRTNCGYQAIALGESPKLGGPKPIEVDGL